MKKWLWIPIVLLGCDGGGSTPPPEPPPEPPPLPEFCGANVIWEAPVARYGGVPISLEELEKYTIYVGEQPGKSESDLILIVDVTDRYANTFYVEGFPYRDSYIYMTVTDIEGRTSPHSFEWVWDCVTGRQYEG